MSVLGRAPHRRVCAPKALLPEPLGPPSRQAAGAVKDSSRGGGGSVLQAQDTQLRLPTARLPAPPYPQPLQPCHSSSLPALLLLVLLPAAFGEDTSEMCLFNVKDGFLGEAPVWRFATHQADLAGRLLRAC